MFIVYGIPVDHKKLLHLFKDELKAASANANVNKWDPDEWQRLWNRHGDLSPIKDSWRTTFIRDLCRLINCCDPDVAIDIFNDVVDKNTATIVNHNRKLFSYPRSSKFYQKVWIWGVGVCTDLVNITDNLISIEDLDLHERYAPTRNILDTPQTFMVPTS